MPTLPYPDPGTPDLRSAGHLLGWIARGQWRTLLGGISAGLVWMCAQAVLPAAIGQGIQVGVVEHHMRPLVGWSLVILALAVVGALAGAVRHYFAVINWLCATFRITQLVGHHAADTGEALTRQLPTGEVVATVATDAMRIGGLYDVLARFIGAIASYVLVAVLLLTTSMPLGMVVLVGVPVLVATLGFILRPLQKRQAAQREESGRLTTLGADTVAGLRVLRGIGGEATFLRRYVQQSQLVRRRGVEIAGVQAALDSAQVLLPGIFVLIVIWIGARFAIQGQITPGDLVAFYGYAAFLVIPLSTATEFADRATRAFVGARKVIRVLSVEPDAAASATEPDDPAPDRDEGQDAASGAPRGVLVDPVSGLIVHPGLLTVVVTSEPGSGPALADRLGRFGPQPTPVTLDGRCLSGLPIQRVRERVVVSESEPRLFSGTLREQLDPRGRHGDREILDAVEVASGADVLLALPDGLDSEVEERGRTFSGGQRQRLGLVRALLTDSEVLVLVDPTSAVDAHTEARIAARLRQARAGRTTVVVSSSPLLLDNCDVAVWLEHGVVADVGTHRELMSRNAAYRYAVIRGEEES